MGFIGKLFVVLHAALSLAVLTWAGGVYTQRIDWNTPPTREGITSGPGIYDRQKAAAEQYSVSVDKAYTRWSSNFSQVDLLERERYPRRTFYQGQLDLVRTGTLGGMAVPQPVQELTYAPNGYLDIRTPTGRKAFEVRPGEIGRSIAEYDRLMAKQLEDIAASQTRNVMAIAEREKLNREIQGVTQPAVVKGLRTQLEEQITIEELANNEDAYAVTFVTNREAEFGLLKKRRDAMTARMNELMEYYKKHPGDKPRGLE